eukprot:jgi/Mesvir1/22565/Mv18570-RA.2
MDSHLPRSQSVDASLAQRAQPWNPHLNLSGAAISGGGTAAGDDERLVPTILLPNQSADVSHFAIDIGGSLIKLVYFSRALSDPMRLATVGGLRSPYPKGGVSSPPLGKHREKRDSVGMDGAADAEGAAGLSGGRLHFVKFETAKLQEFIDFVFSKKLHLCRALGDAVEESLWGYGEGEGVRVKATGGGAYKYADILKEKLHLTLDKVDEMSCLVSGANFLLKTVEDEAFTYIGGVKEFVRINPKSLFPYLLVNIGSGVSMVKVDGDGEGQYERVSGTNIGGGTFWGLCRLLTKCKSFDEMLALSAQGDNSKVDMLVGDIYGGMDYAKVGLSADTIASSFGKVVMEGKDLSDFRPADLALSLVRMVSYNIAQLSYLVAMQYGLRRIILGGFFIRGHLYTMDTMSYAIKFWSKGSMNAHFLRHEGYLGALGAFLKYDNSYVTGLQRNWSFQWVERFPAASVFCAENVSGAAAESNTDAGASSNGTPRSSVPAGELVHDANRPAEASKSWVEKFVEVGSSHLGTGRNGEATPFIKPRSSLELKGSAAAATSRLAGPDPDLVAAEAEAKSMEGMGSVGLRVGVLHLCPTIARFPLLADMDGYEPNTVDIMQDTAELEYWITVLTQQLPNLVEKAIESEGGTEDAIQRGRAFEFSFRAHLARLRGEPAAYGRLGLAGLLSMREDCLREFHFVDAYKPEKEKESAAALQVFPDLLVELDAMEPEARLLALIEGVLAGNIFDWGARACVQLYKTGTILEMYRETRRNVKRPWLVDDFDAFQETWFSRLSGEDARGMYRRALLFVDNAGADVVLGMLPLAREMLYAGIEVRVFMDVCRGQTYLRITDAVCGHWGEDEAHDVGIEVKGMNVD